jgi:hypothetical protein
MRKISTRDFEVELLKLNHSLNALDYYEPIRKYGVPLNKADKHWLPPTRICQLYQIPGQHNRYLLTERCINRSFNALHFSSGYLIYYPIY